MKRIPPNRIKKMIIWVDELIFINRLQGESFGILIEISYIL